MKASTYGDKFADFIRLCEDPESEVVIVHHPEVLGDNYEEIVESLNRLADAGKLLQIVASGER